SRLEDGAAIRGAVAAIHASSREVDAQITVFEIGDPVARREAVPDANAPGTWTRIPAQDRNAVPAGMEVTRQDPANLAAASRYDDLHHGRNLCHASDSAIVFKAAILSRSRLCIYRRSARISATRPRIGRGAAKRKTSSISVNSEASI